MRACGRVIAVAMMLCASVAINALGPDPSRIPGRYADADAVISMVGADGHVFTAHTTPEPLRAGAVAVGPGALVPVAAPSPRAHAGLAASVRGPAAGSPAMLSTAPQAAVACLPFGVPPLRAPPRAMCRALLKRSCPMRQPRVEQDIADGNTQL